MGERSGSGAPARKGSLFPPASGWRATAVHPKVRGTIIREEMRSARVLSSDAAVDRALSLLTPEQAAEVRDVLAVSWCSLTSVRAFHEAVAGVLNEDVAAWHLRVVEHATEQTFNGAFRFVLRLTSPEALVRRASSMYARIFDTGKMEASVVAPGHSVARLTGWPEPPGFHLDGVATGIVTVLRVAKIEARVRWQRTPEGADFEIRSTPRG